VGRKVIDARASGVHEYLTRLSTHVSHGRRDGS
jgi:hypothetical protein